MTSITRDLTIDADGQRLAGTLTIPEPAHGVVVFAHGSGSSRHSPRNIQVAEVLQRSAFATMLFDLLTADEERRDAVDASLRFDISLLSRRLDAAVRVIGDDAQTADLPMGLFGASTGAAAALQTAARSLRVRSVVSRGGRPDLAGHSLGDVTAPVLLIVGERDHQVLELNIAAAQHLRCEHGLCVVPGATHLFPERGALDEVARRAADWFVQTMAQPG